MDLPIYDSMRKLITTPYNRYIDGLQALINDRWDNSTQTYSIIKQETEIGNGLYQEVDISADTAIDIGTGFKKGDDFKVFSYRDLSIEVPLGTMYQTDKDYWVCINTNGFESPTNSVEVRRCNNIMKWVDTTNGNVNKEWCAIDYELSSPQPLKDKDVVVANGHIFVIVQGNERTRSIRKNQRFIFNGQPYKLVGYQTLLNNNDLTTHSTLLYIDMYLDTIQPSDDIENNIANATDYLYGVEVQPDVTQQVNGFVGKAEATVTLNGEVVDREIVWTGNDFVSIEQDGTYTLNGSAGDTAVITATLSGNDDVFDNYIINIVDSVEDKFDIVIDPFVEEVRQKQPMTFSVYLYNNGERMDTDVSYTIDNDIDSSVFNLVQDGHDFTLSVLGFVNTTLSITFIAMDITKSIDIQLKPLF